MTRKEFKRRWEKDARGDGITYDEIAECAKEWGILTNPKTKNINEVTYLVLKEAKVGVAEELINTIKEQMDATPNMEYPNIDALSRGCISGKASEWITLQPEAKAILKELTELRRFRDDNTRNNGQSV